MKKLVSQLALTTNLYVSNGMAAGNTLMEARSQALSEIFERNIKNRIISEGLCLPEVPDEVIARYPGIAAGIAYWCATHRWAGVTLLWNGHAAILPLVELNQTKRRQTGRGGQRRHHSDPAFWQCGESEHPPARPGARRRVSNQRRRRRAGVHRSHCSEPRTTANAAQQDHQAHPEVTDAPGPPDRGRRHRLSGAQREHRPG